MKKLFLQLVCVTLTCFASAQDVKTTLSAEMKAPKSFSFDQHLLSDETGHFVLYTKGNYGLGTRSFESVIQKVDRKFAVLFSQPFKIDEKSTTLLHSQIINKQIIFITAQTDKRDKSLKLACVFFDNEAKYTKSINLFSLEYAESNDLPEVEILLSEDKNKILFLAYPDDEEKKEKQDMYVAVFDPQMNKLMDASYVMPFSKRQTSLKDWEVSNKGEVFLLWKVNAENTQKDTKKEDGKTVSNYDYHLYHFTKDAKEPNELILETKDKFYQGTNIKMDRAGENLNIIAFFREKLKGPIAGIEYKRYNLAEGKINFTRVKQLTSEVIHELNEDVGGKKKKDSEGLDNDFVFKKVISLEDGSTLVLTEEAFVVIVTRTTKYGTVSYPRYYNMDMLFFRIDANGEFRWLKRVPKRQIRNSDLTANSFAVMERANDVCIFYNEHKDNMAKDFSEKPSVLWANKEAVPVMLKISMDGNVARTRLLAESVIGTAILPMECEKVNENDFFIAARNKKRKLFFGEVRFKH